MIKRYIILFFFMLGKRRESERKVIILSRNGNGCMEKLRIPNPSSIPSLRKCYKRVIDKILGSLLTLKVDFGAIFSSTYKCRTKFGAILKASKKKRIISFSVIKIKIVFFPKSFLPRGYNLIPHGDFLLGKIRISKSDKMFDS